MLPTLNSINYTLTIPSTGKKVQYRPYLVKEEKIMMLALESTDPKLMLNTIANTIESCLIDFTGSVRDLCTFDIEYMFLQIRSKSVGESIDVQLSCQAESCKGKKEHTIQFDKVEPPKVAKNKKSNIIKITDEVSLMMRYPSYQNLMNYSEVAETDSKSEQAINTMFSVIIACIEYIIINDEEKIDVSEYSLDDMKAFLDQFTSSQFNLLKEFVANIPELKHSIKWKCNDCGNENELSLKGTNDFFQ
jgi:hypothetical protein